MNENRKFSIVIPFYNEEKKIPALVRSVLAQNYPTDQYEVILVDNMSTDESFVLATKLIQNSRNARVLKCSTFRSSYAARNTGIDAANGEYIVFIDADCIADPELLRNYSRAIESNGEAKIFAGSVFHHTHESTSLMEEYSADRKFLNQDSAVKGWAFRPFAQTANAMFRKAVVEHVGGFHPRMTSGGDGELCWRIAEMTGSAVVHVKEAVVYHWHRDSIRDLFTQFEKYGVGRFQQSAVVKGFDKGLVGASRGAILERFEALEEIVRKTVPADLQRNLLWSLYDLTCRVANVYGYVGAKSLMHSDSKDLFAPPDFSLRCPVCGGVNFSKTATFAVAVGGSHDPNCDSCSAGISLRLLKIAGLMLGEKLALVEFADANHEIVDTNSSTVITVSGTGSFVENLSALALARRLKVKVLIWLPASSRIGEFFPFSHEVCLATDTYTGNLYNFLYVDYSNAEGGS